MKQLIHLIGSFVTLILFIVVYPIVLIVVMYKKNLNAFGAMEYIKLQLEHKIVELEKRRKQLQEEREKKNEERIQNLAKEVETDINKELSKDGIRIEITVKKIEDNNEQL